MALGQIGNKGPGFWHLGIDSHLTIRSLAYGPWPMADWGSRELDSLAKENPDQPVQSGNLELPVRVYPYSLFPVPSLSLFPIPSFSIPHSLIPNPIRVLFFVRLLFSPRPVLCCLVSPHPTQHHHAFQHCLVFVSSCVVFFALPSRGHRLPSLCRRRRHHHHFRRNQPSPSPQDACPPCSTCFPLFLTLSQGSGTGCCIAPAGPFWGSLPLDSPTHVHVEELEARTSPGHLSTPPPRAPSGSFSWGIRQLQVVAFGN